MKVLLSCGGTGGHIYPALAIAEKLQDCFFIGSSRLEKELVPRAGFRFFEISTHKRNLLVILHGYFQALKIILKEKPQIILSTGGYVTIPVILAGVTLGKKIYIQEQNLLPGKVNRLLSIFAKKVFITYDGSRQYFPRKNTVLTGNPIRKEIATVSYDLEKVFTHQSVLFFGGSLSARSINEVVYAMLKKYTLAYEVTHLDGKNYCHSIAELYSKATLIVCRAGATSLAELAAIGIPAILIPYPFAADNHQELNARYFAKRGAAVMLLDKELNADTLYHNIENIINDKSKLKELSKNMKNLSHPEAADSIVREL